MNELYNFHVIERKWRQVWGNAHLFSQPALSDMSVLRRMFAMDAMERFQRMRSDDWSLDTAASPVPGAYQIGKVVFGPKQNRVDPESTLKMYGADATRLFLLFAAPLSRNVQWSSFGVEGAYKFINRLWRLGIRMRKTRPSRVVSEKENSGIRVQFSELTEADRVLWQQAQRMLARVTKRLEQGEKFNTAISAIMEMVRRFEDYCLCSLDAAEKTENSVVRAVFDLLLIVSSPFLPYATQEIWSELGHDGLLINVTWPCADDSVMQESTVNVVVQINGRLCVVLQLPTGADSEEIERAAVSCAKVKARLSKGSLRKVVIRPRLINFVLE